MTILTAPFRLIGFMFRGVWNAMVPPVTTERVTRKTIEDAEQAIIVHTTSMENAMLTAGNHKAHIDMLTKRIKRLKATLPNEKAAK